MRLVERSARWVLVVGALLVVPLGATGCTEVVNDTHEPGVVRQAQCISCHESERASAVNPPHETLPTSCQDCHSEAQWVPAEFAMGHSGARQGDDTFAFTCQDCHTTNAWTPAVGGTHPENAFPIENGAHSDYRDDCVSCHNPDFRSPEAGENADCVGCRDGDHTRAKMDAKHCEENDYPRGRRPRTSA